MIKHLSGHAVVHLVAALRYTPKVMGSISGAILT
jgi:hypothetical protein